MPRSIELVIRDGESVASAVRRFKAKIQNSPQGHSKYKAGKGPKLPGVLPKGSAIKGYGKRERMLFEDAIDKLSALPPLRQIEIAEEVLAVLGHDPSPSTTRFQELVEAKYTRGLTPPESAEMETLESTFRDSDERFYAPLIERAKAKHAALKGRGNAR